MKEVISERYKKPYISLLIISAVTVISGIVIRKFPFAGFASTLVGYLSVAVIVLSVIMAASSLYFLMSPQGVIEKIDNDVIFRIGFRKIVVNKHDILGIAPACFPGNSDKIQENAVTVKILAGGAEKIFVCGGIPDVEAAISKLRSIIG